MTWQWVVLILGLVWAVTVMACVSMWSDTYEKSNETETK